MYSIILLTNIFLSINQSVFPQLGGGVYLKQVNIPEWFLTKCSNDITVYITSCSNSSIPIIL